MGWGNVVHWICDLRESMVGQEKAGTVWRCPGRLLLPSSREPRLTQSTQSTQLVCRQHQTLPSYLGSHPPICSWPAPLLLPLNPSTTHLLSPGAGWWGLTTLHR